MNLKESLLIRADLQIAIRLPHAKQQKSKGPHITARVHSVAALRLHAYERLWWYQAKRQPADAISLVTLLAWFVQGEGD